MKVTSTDGKVFHLTGETPEDQQLIDAVDANGHGPRCIGTIKQQIKNSNSFRVVGFKLEVDPASPASIRADAASQTLRSLGQLVRLGLSEAALDKFGFTAAPVTANPKPQIELAASLEQLQLVVHALNKAISQQKIVIEEMQRAHGVTPVVETPIVAGAAQ